MSNRQTTIVWKTELDADEFLKTLKQIKTAVEQTTAQGNKSFKKIGDNAKLSGVQIGAVAGVVTALTERFIQLGVQAVQAFVKVTESGVNLNASLEQSEAVFTNLFGDPNLGAATIDFLRKASRELKISTADASSFAESILPRTDSLENFSDLLELTTIQARQLGVPVRELTFSIREALSGDFVSIRDRFDLSRAAIDRIKTLSEEVGVSAALATVLREEFDRVGKTQIEGTLTADLATIRAEFENLNVALTQPLFGELKEQAKGFLELFEENRDDIDLVVAALGDLLANIASFSGDNLQRFLDSISPVLVEQFVIQLQGAFSAAQTLLTVLFDLPAANEGFATGIVFINKMAELMITLAEIIGVVRATLTALDASIQLTTAIFALLDADLLRAKKNYEEFKEAAKNGAVDVQGFKDEILKTNEALQAHNKRLEEINAAAAERRNATEKDNSALEQQVDTELALANAREAGAKASEAVAQAEDKLTDAVEDAAKKRAEIDIKQEQRRTETLIRQSEKRVALELKDAQARERIQFKFNQDLTKLAATLPDEEAKAAREAGKKRAEIERQASQQRIEIERDFQRELRRIQDQFNQSAEDAERNNDVQSFVAAVRTAQQQRQQAMQDRDDSRVDATEQAKQQRADLKRALKEELKDVQETNRQKIEALDQRLAEELAKQDLSRQQELERQDLADQQALEQQDRQFQTEVLNFETKELEKQAILQQSIDEQLAMLEAATQRIIELQNMAQQAMADTRTAADELRDNPFGTPFSGGSPSNRPAQTAADNPFGTPTTGIIRAQHGADFIVGGSGGPDSQLLRARVTPGERVTITPPNRVMFSPPAATPLQQQTSSVTNNNSPIFQLAQSMLEDPVARLELENFFMSMMLKAGQQ